MIEEDIIALFHEESHLLDDCVILPEVEEGKASLVSTDTLVENVHFSLDWSSPEQIAKKLFQINLSDIIASGGEVTWCMLNLGIPSRLLSKPISHNRFIHQFAQTLKEQMKEFHCILLGGDTIRSEKLSLSLTMGGTFERYISRCGAKIGDTLYLSGDLGLSYLGLSILKRKISVSKELENLALEKHLEPKARFLWAQEISQNENIHAMIDLSDDLVRSTRLLARASNVDIYVNMDKLPIHPLLKNIYSKEELIFSGEELELLFFGVAGLEFSFPCTPIGFARKRRLPSPEILFWENKKKVSLEKKSFEHFS